MVTTQCVDGKYIIQTNYVCNGGGGGNNHCGILKLPPKYRTETNPYLSNCA